MGWIDSKRAGELSERVNDITKIQEAIGDKVGAGISTIGTLVASWIVGLAKGWKMALVVMSVTPSIVVVVLLMGFGVRKLTAKGMNALAKAGGVAEEVIACIRTVSAFGLQQRETERYDSYLAQAEATNKWKGVVIGAGMGGLMCANFCINAFGFWYGSKLIRDGAMTAGEVTTVFMSIMMGTMSLTGISTTLQAISEGQGVAQSLFKTVDRHSQIDPFSETGAKPEIIGNIEFKDVWFSYPTRAATQVLRGLSLSIKQGETVALVGPSGCGKSTTVSLLERLYQPTGGSVSVDGTDVVTINVKHLRSNIGVVGQEPVLFALSIRDNIALGLSEDVDSVSLDLIQQAAQQSNAHDFIMGLPNKYDTLVGERGVQLSGGQKQRIAIARALIRSPSILLLDEATSALDTESEATVQQALDRASEGRTTLVIAHRLSTVQNADKIVVISQGKVVELGKHDELMRQDGLYSSLVHNQQVTAAVAEEDSAAKEAEEEDQKRHHRHHHHHHRHHHDGGEMEAVEEAQQAQLHMATPMPNASQLPTTVVPSPPLEDEEDEEQPQDEGLSPYQAIKEILGGSEVIRDEETLLPEEEPYRLSSWRMAGRLLMLLKPNALVILAAVLFSLGNGVIFPVFGFIMAKTMGVLVSYDGTNESQYKKDIMKWSFCFVGIGIACLIANLGEFSLILHSYESLVRRLRCAMLGSTLRQNAAWFDEDRNAVGALTTKLAADPPQVEGAAGLKIAFTVQSWTSLIAGAAIGFSGCWQLAFVILAIMPFFSLCTYFKTKLELRQQAKIQKSYEQSGKVACEAIEAARTVAMLGRESKFLDRYKQALRVPVREGYKSGLYVAACNGLNAMSSFVVCAVGYWYGAKLIQQDKTDFNGMQQAQMGIMLGVMMFSTLNAAAPDYGKAKVALRSIFMLLDRVPPIDFTKGGATLDGTIDTISFRHVGFAYPTRPGIHVLRDFSLDVPRGQTIALVGGSGCGKSTVMGLLQRCYDPLTGEIFVNGQEIKTLDLKWLRSQIGIVSQEPVLFGESIKENIARGRSSGAADVPMEDIIAACKLANAHDFISALPQGYDTEVGEKGMQLSGGQKQRIAIGRALLRDPAVLLLDEATSALDTESEKVVQAALDRATKGRTTIVVAHRLSTVQNADVIVAMAHGEVQEMGTHEELLARRGIYYNLARAQQLRT
eukprot:TRINITY_DN6715_c0_g1_i1.p1 TRINITY_DN6715_c0_g1~~TRINITY_DN6715_c0_g1_i1.p1  ORF type:complete len:1371 (-),score=342.00 TRINITY_DN6715_c0_g1_i1:38-3583(-)